MLKDKGIMAIKILNLLLKNKIMRKNIFKAPAKKVNKPKVEVKKPVEIEKPVVKDLKKDWETNKNKDKFFGNRPWAELSGIEKRMLDLYGDKYAKKDKKK